MSAYKPKSLYPDNSDNERDSMRKINALQAGIAGINPDGSQGSGGSTSTPVDSQVEVASTVTGIVSANPNGRRSSIFNNGLQSVWISLDGSDPVADTGTEGQPNGDGKGIRIYPNGLYETATAITTAIKGITLSGTSKVTVSIS